VSGEDLTVAELARLGLGGDEAVPALRTLGVWGDEGALEGCTAVIQALAASPNSALALRGLERVAESSPESWARLAEDGGFVRRAATVAGASDALADLLATSAEAVTALLEDLGPWDAATVADRARAALRGCEDAEASAALAGLQRGGLLRVAARDLLGEADTPAVAEELAALAEGVLTAALEHVTDDPDEVRLAVIGMGKLGGRELNYVSDVDVLFVAEGDWTAATRTAERFLRLLGRHTPQGRSTRSTRTCARRDATATSSAPSSPTRRTTSAGRRPGSSRRC
jgi:[glutamine synthetase] adenylyltransferase / [glutamine synthetase]-adenylyl-L-tyrosine phosphorylase